MYQVENRLYLALSPQATTNHLDRVINKSNKVCSQASAYQSQGQRGKAKELTMCEFLFLLVWPMPVYFYRTYAVVWEPAQLLSINEFVNS